MTKDLVSAIQRIEAARADVLGDISVYEDSLRVFRAKLAAFDVALCELNKATPEEALPVKVPRLDIAKAVLDELAVGPLSLDQLALAIGRKPSQITAAIQRLGSKVEFGGSYGGDQHRCYRLAGSAEQVAA